MFDDDTLARRLSVSELVAVFEETEREIKAGCAQISAAMQTLNRAFCAKDREFYLSSTRRSSFSEYDLKDPTDTLRQLRRQVWSAFIDALEIKRFCSIQAAKQLEQDFDNEEPPPITTETVLQLAQQFRSQMPQLLKQAVDEVFNVLRPPSSNFKTNSEFEIGERVILEGYVERAFYGWTVNYHYEQRLTAIENVFRALDGKGQVTKTHYSEISNAIKACKGDSCEGETEYFEFRGFKKRSLHLRIKRADLLARFNAMAGGMRLKDGSAKGKRRRTTASQPEAAK